MPPFATSRTLRDPNTLPLSITFKPADVFQITFGYNLNDEPIIDPQNFRLWKTDEEIPVDAGWIEEGVLHLVRGGTAEEATRVAYNGLGSHLKAHASNGIFVTIGGFDQDFE